MSIYIFRLLINTKKIEIKENKVNPDVAVEELDFIEESDSVEEIITTEELGIDEDPDPDAELGTDVGGL